MRYISAGPYMSTFHLPAAFASDSALRTHAKEKDVRCKKVIGLTGDVQNGFDQIYSVMQFFMGLLFCRS